MAKGCFLLFILGWETFVWRSYAEQKSNDLFHEAIALRRVAELIQGSNLVIHESLSFFGKKWICHDLSIWIRTYLEATTKQWYLYDHGNRGYHYRKIYWNLGLQEKTVIKGCIGQWTYQSLVSTCSFDAEIKKIDGCISLYIYISLSTIKSMFVRQKPHVPLISTCDVPRPWQGKNPSCCSLLKKGDASSRAAANPSAAACGTKENKIKK